MDTEKGYAMAAELSPAEDRDERSMAAVHRLIAERVPGRFATFADVGEGDIGDGDIPAQGLFPDGTEATSGHVILEDGRVFFWWMDWDAEQGRPVLGTWVEVQDDPSDTTWEYRRARKAVGLE
jgi:hypothetical protein